MDSEKLDMRIDRNRWNRRTLSALTVLAWGGVALLATSPAGALAQTAGSDKPLAGVAGSSASESLSAARDLSDQGKLVQAKAILDRLFRTGAVDSLSDLERTQAMGLVKSNDSRIMAADPLEISLQKSELALAGGDLVEAQRHAKAVADRTGASKAQRDRAAAVMSTIEKRQAALAPAVEGRIEQATADFQAKRYAEAKASILEVLRSGVKLSPEQASRLEREQLQIVEIENSTGHQFEIGQDAGMGMLEQPGAVRRAKKTGEPGRSEPLPLAMNGDQPPQNPPPAQEPPAPPSAEPGMGQPATEPPPPPPAPPPPP
ncbi:MAG TPA: hypothetical protein VHC70_11215, partial [Phycisphaerales bacterium]|nr:hypothetical protein [Phycisphaerales bacterium]